MTTAKANKALVAKRVEDLLRIRLDGAQHWDVCEYVREKQAEPASCWFVAEGETPLSDSQIRRYLQRADEMIYATHERSRKRLFRRHLAQRRHLYARAVTTGDLRTALAVLQDEAKLTGLDYDDQLVRELAILRKRIDELTISYKGQQHG
jgi:hypothetical protein